MTQCWHGDSIAILCVAKVESKHMILKPENKGLYEVRREHDACGIGAVVNVSGQKSHSIIEYSKEVLVNLHHRGAAGGYP